MFKKRVQGTAEERNANCNYQASDLEVYYHPNGTYYLTVARKSDLLGTLSIRTERSKTGVVFPAFDHVLPVDQGKLLADCVRLSVDEFDYNRYVVINLLIAAINRFHNIGATDGKAYIVKNALLQFLLQTQASLLDLISTNETGGYMLNHPDNTPWHDYDYWMTQLHSLVSSSVQPSIRRGGASFVRAFKTAITKATHDNTVCSSYKLVVYKNSGKSGSVPSGIPNFYNTVYRVMCPDNNAIPVVDIAWTSSERFPPSIPDVKISTSGSAASTIANRDVWQEVDEYTRIAVLGVVLNIMAASPVDMLRMEEEKDTSRRGVSQRVAEFFLRTQFPLDVKGFGNSSLAFPSADKDHYGKFDYWWGKFSMLKTPTSKPVSTGGSRKRAKSRSRTRGTRRSTSRTRNTRRSKSRRC